MIFTLSFIGISPELKKDLMYIQTQLYKTYI